MAPGAPPTTNPPPWWAHVLIGSIVIVAGVVLALLSHDPTTQTLGVAFAGSGVTFLGVGAGVAASS